MAGTRERSQVLPSHKEPSPGYTIAREAGPTCCWLSRGPPGGAHPGTTARGPHLVPRDPCEVPGGKRGLERPPNCEEAVTPTLLGD